ncbi:MAG: hypothetical protein ACRD0F_04770, partial [Acidimicrobiales bacterium]
MPMRTCCRGAATVLVIVTLLLPAGTGGRGPAAGRHEALYIVTGEPGAAVGALEAAGMSAVVDRGAGVVAFTGDRRRA